MNRTIKLKQWKRMVIFMEMINLIHINRITVLEKE